MQGFGRRRSSFLSKLIIFAYRILQGFLVHFCSIGLWNKGMLHSPIGRDEQDLPPNHTRFACKSHRNELLHIFCIHLIVLRLNWAFRLPPLPCQRKNGSANTRRHPSKALNEVLNLCQVHRRRPQRVLQDRLGRWHEKTLLSSIGWPFMHMWIHSLNRSSKQMWLNTLPQGPRVH